MARNNEAADAVRETRVATGIHAVAAAVLSANGATDNELELAKRVLLQDPDREAPRESEGAADTFNRHADAVIESCNSSADASTRVGRRVKLARDLDRARLVLVERELFAALLEAKFQLDYQLELEEDEGEDLGAEILDSSAEDDGDVTLHPALDGDGGSYSGLEFIEGSGRAVALDHGVND